MDNLETQATLGTQEINVRENREGNHEWTI